MTLHFVKSSYNYQNMRSNKPIVKKFQEAVYEEILPSIRKKGEYKNSKYN